MGKVRGRKLLGQASRCVVPVPAGVAGNERGVVLVLALVMLALLAILGSWAIGTSSTDLTIAGNFRDAQKAFYSTDAALAYATNPVTLTTAYLYTAATGSSDAWSQVISIGSVTATINVNYLGSGPPPSGSIYDGALDVNGNPRFQGHYFVANIEGVSANNAVVAIEAAVVQVVEGCNGTNGTACTSGATAGAQVFTLYWRQR